MTQRDSTDAAALAELLAATAAGNHAAFQALYAATAPKLMGVVLRITHNRPMAEEVLQETYLTIWQKAERFDSGVGQPMAWLAAIARNRTIDRIRSERIARASVPDDELLALAAPDKGDPTDRAALMRCLEALDAEARGCTLLAYCSGYSREDLAERFGKPVGTIKTLLYRTVRQLKACLEKE